MAAIRSASATPSIAINPSISRKFATISSSNSVFFSYYKVSGGSNRLGGVRLGRRSAVDYQRKGMSCNCLFGLGVPELVVIAGVTALVFGPKQLPEVGRSMGKTIKSFQQAAKEFESELKKDSEASAAAGDDDLVHTQKIKEEEKEEEERESLSMKKQAVAHPLIDKYSSFSFNTLSWFLCCMSKIRFGVS